MIKIDQVTKANGTVVTLSLNVELQTYLVTNSKTRGKRAFTRALPARLCFNKLCREEQP